MRSACWIFKDKNTFRICNTYYPSTATIVTAKQLNFTLNEQNISCFFFSILFVSYRLLWKTFLNHLLSFSGIRRLSIS